MKRCSMVTAVRLAVAVGALQPLAARAQEQQPRVPPLPGLLGAEGKAWTGWNWAMRPEGNASSKFSPFLRTDEPPVLPQTIAVRNPVAISFTFAIWNPKSEEWERFEASQGRTDITCSPCSEKARITFHNGNAQVTYIVRLGTVVALQWSADSKLWTLVEGVNPLLPESDLATIR